MFTQADPTIKYRRKVIQKIKKLFSEPYYDYDFDQNIFIYKKRNRTLATYNPENFDFILYARTAKYHELFEHSEFSRKVIEKYARVRVKNLKDYTRLRYSSRLLTMLLLLPIGVLFYWHFKNTIKVAPDEKKKNKKTSADSFWN